jgi:hypothetical protein
MFTKLTGEQIAKTLFLSLASFKLPYGILLVQLGVPFPVEKFGNLFYNKIKFAVKFTLIDDS